MKLLEKEFTRCGWSFKQIVRDGNFAIYERWKENLSPHFEAIEIRSHNGYEIGGVQIAPAEIYPSDNVWGVYGFTCPTRQEAMQKISKLMSRQINSLPNSDGSPNKRGRGRPKGAKNKSKSL